MIKKYNTITGDILAHYESIKDVCKHDKVTYAKVYKMLQQKELKYPRDNYYFGYKPKARFIIRCYDNENLELLGSYINIKQASERTGVNASQIQWQVAKDLPITQNRIKGSTTLFFKREKISY